MATAPSTFWSYLHDMLVILVMALIVVAVLAVVAAERTRSRLAEAAHREARRLRGRLETLKADVNDSRRAAEEVMDSYSTSP
jgi:CHASE1-domain containing sensor protein